VVELLLQADRCRTVQRSFSDPSLAVGLITNDTAVTLVWQRLTAQWAVPTHLHRYSSLSHVQTSFRLDHIESFNCVLSHQPRRVQAESLPVK
jgi:hypothetical protein